MSWFLRCWFCVALFVAPHDALELHRGMYPVPKVHMVTFGNARYADAALRLKDEAEQSGLFDSIFAYTEFPDFIKSDKRWSQHLTVNHGAGYWFWKAPLVKHALNATEDGDIVMYVDSGCELGDVARFQDIIEDLCHHDIVGYDIGEIEQKWTKGDIFKKFGVSVDDPYFGKSAQIGSTYFSVRNTAQTRDFMRHWEWLLANLRLVGDGPSVKRHNDETYQDAREDQSLFSMLMKANQPNVHVKQRYVIPGLRALIAKDRGFPPNSEKALVMASRNPGGVRIYGPEVRQVSMDEKAEFKQKLRDCATSG